MGVGGQGVQKWVRHVLSMAQYAPTPGPTGPSEATGAATGQPASLLPEFTPQTPTILSVLLAHCTGFWGLIAGRSQHERERSRGSRVLCHGWPRHGGLTRALPIPRGTSKHIQRRNGWAHVKLSGTFSLGTCSCSCLCSLPLHPSEQ